MHKNLLSRVETRKVLYGSSQLTHVIRSVQVIIMHTFEERGRTTEWTTVLTPFLVDIRGFPGNLVI